MVYVAFVLDTYSRRILGWRAATTMKTSLVLDALAQALWTRRRDGIADLSGLVHQTDAGSQYTSIAFTEGLAKAGIGPSVGSVGDAFDDALAESVIGLLKTELIKPGGPWRTVEQVEIATLEWVDWFNHRRLLEACGDIPPTELEQAHYHRRAALARPATQASRSPDMPGGFKLPAPPPPGSLTGPICATPSTATAPDPRVSPSSSHHCTCSHVASGISVASAGSVGRPTLSTS
jgi:hypothetical protein